MSFKHQPGEEWKSFELGNNSALKYAISNHGRLMSFTETFDDGRLLKGSLVEGFKVLRFKITKDNKVKNGHKFLHKLVAEMFVEGATEEKCMVLHLDHNKANNYAHNLKWATKSKRLEHVKKSPAVIKAKKQLIAFNIQRDGHKLNATQVMRLKKKIFDPNRKTRLKLLAKQFGITEMQLHRIKTGENWGHIVVPGLDTTYQKKPKKTKVFEPIVENLELEKNNALKSDSNISVESDKVKKEKNASKPIAQTVPKTKEKDMIKKESKKEITPKKVTKKVEPKKASAIQTQISLDF